MKAARGLLARALDVSFEELAKEALAPVPVAVLDTGIDGSHPDLAGRVTKSVTLAGGADGKVKINDSDPSANNDLYGHGTGVASIIARIAPNAQLIDLRVLDGDNRCSPEVLLEGFDHAMRSDARLLNMSLAASETYAAQLNAICEDAYRRGKVIVAARNNNPFHGEGFPAALIPCVGVDNDGAGPEGHWFYRNDIIEFAAFGENVAVAAEGGGYTTMTGSSFATPIVAGFVCLLLGAYPELRPFEVKAVLKAMATTR